MTPRQRQRDGGKDQAERQRGRPRDPAIDDAILNAAVDLIAERGYAYVTIGEVAERAKVPKSTIYRRYESRGELLLEAARQCVGQSVPIPDTGSLREDLLVQMRAQVKLFSKKAGIIQLSLAAINDVELRDVMRGLGASQRVTTTTIFERAIERGEIPAETHIDLVIDLMRGIGWAQFLEMRKARPGQPEQVVDILLGGIATSSKR